MHTGFSDFQKVVCNLHTVFHKSAQNKKGLSQGHYFHFKDLSRTLLYMHLILNGFWDLTYNSILEVPKKNPRIFGKDFQGLLKTNLYVKSQKPFKNKCFCSNVLGKSIKPSVVLDKSFLWFLKILKFFGDSVITFKNSVLKVLKSLKFLNLVF